MNKGKSTNVVWHEGFIARNHRETLLGQKGAVLWFTGLSGSGKSTIAADLESKLNQQGRLTYILDGDNLRHGLNQDLGFSLPERRENMRRTGEVAKLMADAGLITLVSLVSPLREERNKVRAIVGSDFIEIYIDCPLEICESRDPKGLYGKARAGQIPEFTGITSPYEPPMDPEIALCSGSDSIEKCVDTIYSYLKSRNIVTT